MDSSLTPAAAGSEVECPSCGTVAVNSDFCACGEYVGWELPTLDPEAPAAGPAEYHPPAPAEVTREVTLLSLRDPARDDAAGADVAVSVVPGAEVAILATVRNQSQIVDTFDLRVEGLPDGWWTATPAAVFLNPWGTSGAYEQEAQLRLHPPRMPESEARAWPLTVLVRSRSLGVDVAWVRATLIVLPFQSTEMSIAPERRRGRRHASFDVTVANHGNSPMEIAIGAQDTEARCPVSIAPARMPVPVGAAATGIVLVDVPRPLIVGRPIDHHVEITHRATGVDSAPVPQRVTFRQKPWLPWWVPPVLALLAAFVAAVLLLRRDPEVPKLAGSTVAEAQVVLAKLHLKVGRTRYDTAPKDVALDTIIGQQPAAGDNIDKGEPVDIILAAPPTTGIVPPVNGRTLAEAADALKAARFAYSPQPSSAGNDWVVIRQDPTPGTRLAVGKPVTLAVEQRTPATTPTPTPTPTGTPTPTATPKASATPKATATAKPGASTAKPPSEAVTAATANVKAKLPKDLIFAGATSGLLYRWGSGDAKAVRLTSPTLRFETPVTLDDGFAAVQVIDGGRTLVRVSADGKTIDPLAEGDYHRPAYSPDRGLLAVIAAGRGDAGELCTVDPQATAAPVCASGHRVGRPAWAPNGRSLLALAGGYDELLTYTATGGDPRQWKAVTAYRAAQVQSAAWVGNDRIAVLTGSPAHLRLLARRPNGSFEGVKDFPALTGCELAATGHTLALRRGNCATGDGAMILLDVDRAQPRLRGLTSGVNPAWAT